jgi:hypothetical protein
VFAINDQVLVLPMAVCSQANEKTSNFRHVLRPDKLPPMILPTQIFDLVSELQPGYNGHLAFLVSVPSDNTTMHTQQTCIAAQEDDHTTEIEMKSGNPADGTLVRYTSQDTPATVCAEFLVKYKGCGDSLHWSVLDDHHHDLLYLGCGQTARVVNADVVASGTGTPDHGIVLVVNTARKSMTMFDPQPFESAGPLPDVVTVIASLLACKRMFLLSGHDSEGVCGAVCVNFLGHLAELGIKYVNSNENLKVCLQADNGTWMSTSTIATAKYQVAAVSLWVCVTCLLVDKVAPLSVPDQMTFGEKNAKTLRFLVIRTKVEQATAHWSIWVRVHECVWVEHETTTQQIHLHHIDIKGFFGALARKRQQQIYMAWYGPVPPDWIFVPGWSKKRTIKKCGLVNNSKDCSIEVVLYALCQIKHENCEQPKSNKQEKQTMSTSTEGTEVLCFSQLIDGLMLQTTQVQLAIQDCKASVALPKMTLSPELWVSLRLDVRNEQQVDQTRATNNAVDMPSVAKGNILSTKEFSGKH